MKTKTSELAGPALDWAVGHALRLALGYDYEIVDGVPVTGKTIYTREGLGFDEVWSPSTNWAQGGPIIDREDTELMQGLEGEFKYKACITPNPNKPHFYFKFYGPTKLVAAMRCFVMSKLGDEVDVPEELK